MKLRNLGQVHGGGIVGNGNLSSCGGNDWAVASTITSKSTMTAGPAVNLSVSRGQGPGL